MIRCSCSKWDRENDNDPHAQHCAQSVDRILLVLFHGSRVLAVDSRWLKVESGREEPVDLGPMKLDDNVSLQAMHRDGLITLEPPLLGLTEKGLRQAMRADVDAARARSKLGTLASVERFEAGNYLIRCQPGNGSAYELSCFTRVGAGPAAWVVCLSTWPDRPSFLWHAEDDRSLGRIKRVVKNAIDAKAVDELLRANLPAPTNRSYQI
jgi:hypothetical protein